MPGYTILMHVRPYPLLTAFAIPVLVLLVWLGVWQAQRADWKTAEVASFKERLDAPAMQIDAICAAGIAEQQIMMTPPSDGAAIRLFGMRASGKPGWKVFQASAMCGRPILVQKGFEELEKGYKSDNQCAEGAKLVDDSIALLSSKGITGTPTYLFADGKFQSGVLEPDTLRQRLGLPVAAKKPPAAAPAPAKK